MNTIPFVKITYPDSDPTVEYVPYDNDWFDEFERLNKLHDGKLKIEFIEINQDLIIWTKKIFHN